MNATAHNTRKDWLDYLNERKGTYEYRTIRYAAVADVLESLGLRSGDMVVDVGAGMCDFDRYLRTVRAFDGRYLPVDGAIDGTDLNTYRPNVVSEFYTAIETIEHLAKPFSLLRLMESYSTKGAVITTPNFDVWGDRFYGMDRTHISPFRAHHFEELGWEYQLVKCFGKEKDTIVAWYNNRKAKPEELTYMSPEQINMLALAS